MKPIFSSNLNLNGLIFFWTISSILFIIDGYWILRNLSSQQNFFHMAILSWFGLFFYYYLLFIPDPPDENNLSYNFFLTVTIMIAFWIATLFFVNASNSFTESFEGIEFLLYFAIFMFLTYAVVGAIKLFVPANSLYIEIPLHLRKALGNLFLLLAFYTIIYTFIFFGKLSLFSLPPHISYWGIAIPFILFQLILMGLFFKSLRFETADFFLSRIPFILRIIYYLVYLSQSVFLLVGMTIHPVLSFVVGFEIVYIHILTMVIVSKSHKIREKEHNSFKGFQSLIILS